MHAKCIFISKLNPKSHCYDIGIVDDDYQYFECQALLKNNQLTYSCIKSLNRIFSCYVIDKNTNVSMLNTIAINEALYLYMFILKQQSAMNMKFVDLDMIPRRIAAYHITYLGRQKKSSSITRHMIQRLWNKLVQLEKCPWISKSVDDSLQLKSNIAARRNKILRLGLYYMLVKKFLVDKVQKYKNKL